MEQSLGTHPEFMSVHYARGTRLVGTPTRPGFTLFFSVAAGAPDFAVAPCSLSGLDFC